MTTINAFAERLTELRENSGKKRQEVADDICISRASLEYYEKGKRKPDIEVLLKLADYYGVTCDYLLKGVKTENIKIHEATGLSDEAIEELSSNKRMNIEGFWEFETGNFEILNKFIEKRAIFEICLYVDNFYSAAKYQKEICYDILDLINNSGFPDSEEFEKMENAQKEMDLCLFRLQEINTNFTKEMCKELLTEIKEIKEEIRKKRIAIEVQAYKDYLERTKKDGENNGNNT